MFFDTRTRQIEYLSEILNAKVFMMNKYNDASHITKPFIAISLYVFWLIRKEANVMKLLFFNTYCQIETPVLLKNNVQHSFADVQHLLEPCCFSCTIHSPFALNNTSNCFDIFSNHELKDKHTLSKSCKKTMIITLTSIHE